MLRLSNLRLAVCAVLAAIGISGCVADVPPAPLAPPTSTSTVATTPVPTTKVTKAPHPEELEVDAERAQLKAMVENGARPSAILYEYCGNAKKWRELAQNYDPQRSLLEFVPLSPNRLRFRNYKDKAVMWYQYSSREHGDAEFERVRGLATLSRC